MEVIQVAARAGAGGDGGIAGVTGTNAPGSLPGGKPGDYVSPPSPPPPPPPASPNVIIAIADDQDVPLVLTQAPHGLASGQSVTISGNAEATYNGVQADIFIVTPNAFQLGVAGVIGLQFGGTWVLNPP